MIALAVVVVVLLLILLLPVGADISYEEKQLALKAKIGPLRLQLFPKKEKAGKKPKKKKEKPEKPQHAEGHRKKRKPTKDDIFSIAEMILKALSRFRRSLSVDLFRLHIVAAADDPYDSVMQYGYINAALSSLSPLFHKALTVRREDIRTDVDVESGEMILNARLIAACRIWKLLYIAICAGGAFLGWHFTVRGREKAEKKAEAAVQKGN